MIMQMWLISSLRDTHRMCELMAATELPNRAYCNNYNIVFPVPLVIIIIKNNIIIIIRTFPESFSPEKFLLVNKC